MTNNIKGMTQSLRWLSDIITLFQTEVIKIPKKYREKVTSTKQLLESDVSGFINTLLDFSISSALVKYTIETNNKNLTESLNNWLVTVNSEYRTKIPTGIDALAKEYFRERWKGSSNLVLRTFWTTKEEITLPTTMFFVDGEDVVTKRADEKVVTLGDEKYFIRINSDENDNIAIPQTKNEILFIQRPFESWGVLEPTPYIIKKGLYRNLKFLSLMSEKGEYIIGRALEYLFLIKKGSENMTMSGRAELTYSPEDLRKITTEFSALLDEKKSDAGTPTYATNFDTQLEHIIPDYNKAINETIYAPIERKILAGLGLVDIVTGTASTRREALLNPKPFIAEIMQGIKDFKSLLNDILETIKEKNTNHKKYFSDKTVKIQVHSSPVEHFLDDKIRDHIRSMYDRGTISIETYNSVVGVGYVDHDVEVKRREAELDEGLEDLMYPHIIDNREGVGKDLETEYPGGEPIEEPIDEPVEEPKTPPDKKGPEAKNYKGELILEEAPYTPKHYPPQLKHLPAGARSLWIRTFNAVLTSTRDENQARQAAWHQVKNKYKKVGEKWVRKTQGNIENSEPKIEIPEELNNE
jgi:hypothetical protein